MSSRSSRTSAMGGWRPGGRWAAARSCLSICTRPLCYSRGTNAVRPRVPARWARGRTEHPISVRGQTYVDVLRDGPHAPTSHRACLTPLLTKKDGLTGAIASRCKRRNAPRTPETVYKRCARRGRAARVWRREDQHAGKPPNASRRRRTPRFHGLESGGGRLSRAAHDATGCHGRECVALDHEAGAACVHGCSAVDHQWLPARLSPHVAAYCLACRAAGTDAAVPAVLLGLHVGFASVRYGNEHSRP